MYDKYVLPEKCLLENAAALERFQYSPSGKELNAQTDISKKQYQKLDDAFKFDQTNKRKKKTS